MPPLFSDPSSRIIVALDTADGEVANRLVRDLAGHVGYFKVGPELLLSVGATRIFDWLPAEQVMLDLKLHDIPETVERTVAAALRRGVAMVTLHIQQRETLRRVVELTDGSHTTALGVTVLTSLDAEDLADLQIGGSNAIVAEVVEDRMALGYVCGLRGFVCSPHEVRWISDAHPDAVFVVPGIRYPEGDKGDQKRTGTPFDAIINGASALVVGRPIRDAQDPLAVVRRITADIEQGLLHRSRGSRVLG